MLTFGKGNAKLDKTVVTFSLPAGWTCPGASLCKSRVSLKEGKRKIVDGPDTQFRCFAASQEALYPAVYNARQRNLKELRDCKTSNQMASLILSSLPKNPKIVRIHVSGDFFSQKYFDAWVSVAKKMPDTIFYAYTKSIPYVIKRRLYLPNNLRLTASIGGRYDSLIKSSGIRSARVVFSEKEAKQLGLKIDKDDSLAIGTGGNFALLLHGVQPAGTKAAAALVQLKRLGKGSYPARKKNV